MKLAMGQYDAPLNQEQPVFYLDPYLSNIAVFGSPMSGKTTFIKTLLVRLHENMEQVPEENIYLIDFGGNIGDYGHLGNVCACFDNSNEENIKRVFRTVEKRLSENAEKLDSRNYYTVVNKTPQNAPAHIFLIIENINAFLADERYASYQEKLQKLCRDGLSKGLTVVITANDTTGLGRILTNFGQKIAFDMPNESYFEIFNSKVAKPMKLPGRGIVNIKSENYEFQCFMPFPDLDDDSYIRDLVASTGKRENKNKMAAFSEDLTKENFSKYCTDENYAENANDVITVGLDYYEHKPITVNIKNSRSVAIYGKRQFGKTNLLSLLIEGISRLKPGSRYVFLDDGRKQLVDFHSGNKKPDGETVYLTDVANLRDYLTENGYGGLRRSPNAMPRMAEITDTPFTVFVLQSKMIFRNSPDSKYLMTSWFPVMIGDADARNYLFIFADVGTISEAEIRVPFNDNISVAFLLDSIGEFVAEKGNKSVFGEMDAQELKTEYAKCSVGDGYIYDTEADELQKLKFIKT